MIAGGGVIARHYISHARNFDADESTLDELGIEISRLNVSFLQEFPKISSMIMTQKHQSLQYFSAS